MPTYLLQAKQPPAHRFAYIGIPHDSATSIGNPGARFAPDALREALRGVFDWRLRDGKIADVDEGLVDLSLVEVADWGDVELTYAETDTIVEESCTAVQQVLEAGYVPLIVGGDHSISYPCIKALHDTRAGRIGLIQIDAHNDLMNYSRRQGKYSGSSGMRRALELQRLKGANLVQIGLRGYTTVEQYTIGQEYGVHRISAIQFAEMGARVAARQALQWATDGTEAVYLTIDLDVINPGEAPGTGWPEPGGLTTQQVIDVVRVLAPHMAAMDIAELNPLYDTQARATTLIAARLILDFITTRVRLAN
jgi:formiminoglutamase/agmatinase